MFFVLLNSVECQVLGEMSDEEFNIDAEIIEREIGSKKEISKIWLINSRAYKVNYGGNTYRIIPFSFLSKSTATKIAILKDDLVPVFIDFDESELPSRKNVTDVSLIDFEKKSVMDVAYLFVSGNQGSLINEAIVLSYREDLNSFGISIDKTNLLNCYIEKQSKFDSLEEAVNFTSLKKYIGLPCEW
ncbi:hypothetical protein FHW67_002771 [Herbaspirillum sp. Sphag1AN]|uniref:hypothetical protein n=1 Tax=unclassified Herbaspirillum TaxID=2624150 RepID=UPI00161F7B4A|nr:MULTISPECIES: hypothetical protein [unclassified Herbaspirillum]MBB3213479.1 hypothetical protein [Herbaspirillum sp. Sphag1AN]MBB3246477.1 hypothetical protein [Herbaspirillum sp. Sphag64]